MSRTLSRIAVDMAASAAASVVALSGALAHAATTTGLVFYRNKVEVATFPVADGLCKPFSKEADALAAYTAFETVIAYVTADCTGQLWGLSTLCSFAPGRFVSFQGV